MRMTSVFRALLASFDQPALTEFEQNSRFSCNFFQANSSLALFLSFSVFADLAALTFRVAASCLYCQMHTLLSMLNCKLIQSFVALPQPSCMLSSDHLYAERSLGHLIVLAAAMLERYSKGLGFANITLASLPDIGVMVRTVDLVHVRPISYQVRYHDIRARWSVVRARRSVTRRCHFMAFLSCRDVDVSDQLSEHCNMTIRYWRCHEHTFRGTTTDGWTVEVPWAVARECRRFGS